MTTEVKMTTLPDCDFCKVSRRRVEKAEYDFKTNRGPWAYGCEVHYQLNRLYADLGTGKGQKLVLAQ